jgi:hypothetical protein
MQVRMRISVSGTRDGKAWPSKGETIDLPDDEARNLVAIGVAAELDEDEQPEPLTEPVEENAAAPVEAETATPAKSAAASKPAPKPAK